MKIFMTGATGYIGSAIASAFLNAGHELTALVRQESDSAALSMSGVRVIPGELSDIGELSATLEEHDVLIHAAKDHSDAGPDLDRAVIDAMTRNFEQPRTVIYTSGVWVIGDTGGETADEESEPDPIEIVEWRVDHEKAVIEAGEQSNVRTVVIRPGCVYGGKESLLADWFEAANRGEPLSVVGDGANQWAMVYLDDVADLYLLAAENEEVSGVLHAIDDSSITLNGLAAKIASARGLGSSVENLPVDEAREKIGGVAEALALDQKISSEKTRTRTGWAPSIERIDDQIERLWAEWEATRG